MGYKLITNDTFTSIPGLKLWLDSRFLVKKESALNADAVTQWNDIIELAQFFKIAESSPIQSSNDYPFMNFSYSGSSGYQKRLGIRDENVKNKFEFLHKLTPYGIYWIYNCENVDSTYTIVGTRGTTGRGFQLERQGAGFPRFRIGAFNDSGTGVFQMTTPFASAYGRNESTNYWSVLCRGNNTTNGYSISRGGVVLAETNIGTISNNGSPSFFRIGGEASNSTVLGIPELNYGLILIYDWNGYTNNEITNYDARIKSLLQTALNNFQ
jgi:hypothetical protein